jgi:hypothetical protein
MYDVARERRRMLGNLASRRLAGILIWTAMVTTSIEYYDALTDDFEYVCPKVGQVVAVKYSRLFY